MTVHTNAATTAAATSNALPLSPLTVQELDRIHDMATLILADLDRIEAALNTPLLTM